MTRIVTSLLLSVSVLAFFINLATAADCKQPRKEENEKQKKENPTGEQIKNALTKADALPNLCDTKYPDDRSHDTDYTYNHWQMMYKVHRNDGNREIQYCEGAFQQIIDQCIAGGDYWGGEWVYDGFNYSIWNSIYEDQTSNNPLGPADDGGLPATASESATAALPAGATVITESVDGHPVPVTFVPTTFPGYSTLQSTTTITTTTTDDSGAIIIVPWVLGIGGLAFIPFGGGPLPAGITPPPVAPVDPDEPNDNDDDQTTEDQQSSSSSSSSSCTRGLRILPPGTMLREGFNPPDWMYGGVTATSKDAPKPTTTTDNAPQPTSDKPPPESPRPTDRNCYQGKVHSPFRSFNEGTIKDPVAQYCSQYANEGSVDQVYPLDGKSWLDSENLVELQAVRRCSDSTSKDEMVEDCKFAFGAIVYDCDYGSGEKWGGTANFKCMSYKVNGLNKGDKTTSWEGNGPA